MAGSKVFTVPELDEPTATGLLRKVLIAPEVVNVGWQASELLKQLAFLPLAIVQAAAYINASGISLAKYMSLLS